MHKKYLKKTYSKNNTKHKTKHKTNKRRKSITTRRKSKRKQKGGKLYKKHKKKIHDFDLIKLLNYLKLNLSSVKTINKKMVLGNEIIKEEERMFETKKERKDIINQIKYYTTLIDNELSDFNLQKKREYDFIEGDGSLEKLKKILNMVGQYFKN